MKNINQLQENEDSLTNVIARGKKLGYNEEFTYRNKSFVLVGQFYKPEDLSIEFEKKFTEMAKPADEMIYFRIAANDGRKGFYITGYGVNRDDSALNFLKNVAYTDKI